jgi:hypothetical protein
MFVNKWTVQMNYPGQLEERGFDSEEELAAYIRAVQAKCVEGLHPVITVLDPNGEESSIALTQSVPQHAA